MESLTPRVHRNVVSFVRRSTRMNESQQRAWQRHAERFVVPVPKAESSTSVAADAQLDWASVFGRKAPLIVEIGSGAGDSLVPMSQHYPDHNIVAFEVYEPAVASALTKLDKAAAPNVKLVVADGVQGLTQLFQDGSVEELWTFFADPWQKKRHHKRRLVGSDFTTLATRKLAMGGRWRLATDWEDYAHWMREHLDPHPGLKNEHDGWAPRLDLRPITKYEAKGLAAGRTVFDLTYRRVDATPA